MRDLVLAVAILTISFGLGLFISWRIQDLEDRVRGLELRVEILGTLSEAHYSERRLDAFRPIKKGGEE